MIDIKTEAERVNQNMISFWNDHRPEIMSLIGQDSEIRLPLEALIIDAEIKRLGLKKRKYYVVFRKQADNCYEIQEDCSSNGFALFDAPILSQHQSYLDSFAEDWQIISSLSMPDVLQSVIEKEKMSRS